MSARTKAAPFQGADPARRAAMVARSRLWHWVAMITNATTTMAKPTSPKARKRKEPLATPLLARVAEDDERRRQRHRLPGDEERRDVGGHQDGQRSKDGQVVTHR